MTCEQARELAKSMLSEERFYHTECVAGAAVRLAKKYGCDTARAERAALLHDILKERDKAALLQMLKSSDIIDYVQIEECPALYHSYAGGIYVKDELKLDMETADAVRYHTAGRENMTLLDKVVFLADYISEDRDFKGADEVREIAEDSLDEAVLVALRNGLIHLFKQYRYANVESVKAYNYLVKNRGDV
ncbi:MAG: bis(5'-nucleosyl)-tetraphosphatase (symmetrical) YqeK [Oscillospiraceae bacterium]